MTEHKKPATKDGWTRGDKIGAAALILGLFGTIAAWLVFFVPPAAPPLPPSAPASTSLNSLTKTPQDAIPAPTQHQPPTQTISSSADSTPKRRETRGQGDNSESSATPTIDTTGLSAQAMNDKGFEFYSIGDFQKARQWYTAAANAGHPDAMYSLGRIYEEAQGMQRPDYSQAFNWYHQAINSGSTDALYGLGHIYDNGEGVKQDHEQARQYFEKAAARGCVPAMTALGRLYEFHLVGETKNVCRAREWYGKAAEGGDELAKQRLAQLPPC